MDLFNILLCRTPVDFIFNVKSPIGKGLNTILLTLSPRMGLFNILLCLTPDDFTCQCDKSRLESQRVNSINEILFLIQIEYVNSFVTIDANSTPDQLQCEIILKPELSNTESGETSMSAFSSTSRPTMSKGMKLFILL